MEKFISKQLEEKTTIRKELSKLSFEELQKLKEKLGTKVYNEAMFGSKRGNSHNTQSEYMRANKNRPREMSSKKPVNSGRKTRDNSVKTHEPRDPRFDSLCGTFNEKAFKTAYSFVTNIKMKEREELVKLFNEEHDVKRKANIKYLIERFDNQVRQDKIRKMVETKKREEKQHQIELLQQGKKPIHMKKSQKRTLELIEKFDELKKTGKLKKHLIKQNKKKRSYI